MIEILQLTHRYTKQANLLENLSLAINDGEWIIVKGGPQSGKTTLLRLLAGLERPTSGEIRWQGEKLRHINARSRLRQHIGLFLHAPLFLDDRTLHANLALPLEIQGMPRAEIEPRVTQALQRVGLSGRESCYPLQLSQTEQHRLNLARAIVARPTLLLVDDNGGDSSMPFTPLLRQILEVFHQSGVTIVEVRPSTSVTTGKTREIILPGPTQGRL